MAGDRVECVGERSRGADLDLIAVGDNRLKLPHVTEIDERIEVLVLFRHKEAEVGAAGKQPGIEVALDE